MSAGGDGNTKITFTSRPDAARYITYVLTHLPPDQLKNRAFAIGGDNKVMSDLKNPYMLHPTNERLSLSRSTKYSRRMKRRVGRSWRSLTFPFLNSMQDWRPIRRTWLLTCTSSGPSQGHSSELTTTSIPTGIHHLWLIISPLRRRGHRTSRSQQRIYIRHIRESLQFLFEDRIVLVCCVWSCWYQPVHYLLYARIKRTFYHAYISLLYA